MLSSRRKVYKQTCQPSVSALGYEKDAYQMSKVHVLLVRYAATSATPKHLLCLLLSLSAIVWRVFCAMLNGNTRSKGMARWYVRNNNWTCERSVAKKGVNLVERTVRMRMKCRNIRCC